MLAIISPAKTLDFDSPPQSEKYTTPSFLGDSEFLIQSLQQYSSQEISELMGISNKLAELNQKRYATWHKPFTPENSKQAILAFKGDVYQGLEVNRYNEWDLAAAQKHLRILSGLYGLLKPLDLIQPYRLEMGTNLKTDRANNLYQFWGQKLTDGLQEALDEQHTKKSSPPILINLASNEYFSAINDSKLHARVITPTFKDLKNGKYKFISFYAKKARGLMASYIVKNRLKKLELLKDFNWTGYEFSEEESDGDQWVFLRSQSE